MKTDQITQVDPASFFVSQKGVQVFWRVSPAADNGNWRQCGTSPCPACSVYHTIGVAWDYEVSPVVREMQKSNGGCRLEFKICIDGCEITITTVDGLKEVFDNSRTPKDGKPHISSKLLASMKPGQ